MSLPRFLFFGAFLFCTYFAFSSPDDSLSDKKTYKTVVRYFYEKDFIYGKINYRAPDSTVIGIDRVNPALDNHYNFLSTNGSAAQPQVFNVHISPTTFTGPRTFDILLLNTDSIRSWRMNKRFSQIDYSTGAFKEQKISLLHAQNITKGWNAGFIFDRQGVKDFMNFSNTFRSRFAFFTWYTTPGKQYTAFASMLINSIKNGVNGGLENDSLFDFTNVSNLGIKGLAYNISEAEEHVRSKTFTFSHYFDLGNSRDSAGNLIRKSPPLRLHHRFSFERKSYVYIDTKPDSSFYSDFFYGSATNDSLHSDRFNNRFAVQLPADTGYGSAFFRNWSSGLFAEIQHTRYGQRTDSSWDNIGVGANVLLKKDSSSIEIASEATYIISGFDKDNYLLTSHAYSPDYKFGRLSAVFNFSTSSADLNYRLYDGNNFIWRNNFLKIHAVTFALSYQLSQYNFSLTAKKTGVDNYVFLDRDARPHQYTGYLEVNQIELRKNFKFRSLHFDNTVTYQKTDRKNILHLPEFVSDQSLYIERFYFKKALLLATGFAGNFNSSYYADAFMPATAMFYLQDEKKTGGYMRIDLFINAKIKTARIFIRMENIADGLFDRSYYLTPHYPMPGRVLKFGVTWRFFDQ